MELLDAVAGLDLDSLIGGSHVKWLDPPSSLAQIIEDYKDHPFYLENKDQIQFELNHLELHKLDNFYVSCYENNGFFQASNPGDSYISYLIGLTDKPPGGQLKTTGGSVPDWTIVSAVKDTLDYSPFCLQRQNDNHVNSMKLSRN